MHENEKKNGYRQFDLSGTLTYVALTYVALTYVALTYVALA